MALLIEKTEEETLTLEDINAVLALYGMPPVTKEDLVGRMDEINMVLERFSREKPEVA